MKSKLHVDVIGQGPDLVLLHGWGLNSQVWSAMAPMLAEHHRLHLVDLPGFGHSSMEQLSDFSLERLAEAVLAEVPSQAQWLGWSLGGLVATQAALIAPKRIAGLILVATSPRFVELDDWKGIRADVLATFTQQLEGDPTATIDRFLAIQAMGSPSVRGDLKALRSAVMERPLPQPAALKQGLSILAETDLRPQLDTLACDVLRIYGRRDSLAPPAQAEQIAAAEGSQYHVIDRASHAPFISHPQQFLQQVLAFTGQALTKSQQV